MKKILAAIMTMLVLTTAVFGMSVSAAESDFVPSMEMKPGPDVVEQETDDGRPGYAIIVMPDGSQIPVSKDEIVITPIGDADSADDDIRDSLEDAFKDIVDAGQLDELVKDLQDVLDQIASGTDVDDLVITDLFHVLLSDNLQKYIDDGGILKIVIKGTDGLLAAIQKLGGAWSVLFGENFIDNGDGTYTLILSGTGIYALFKSVAGVDVDYDDPAQSSPQTGDYTVLVMSLSFALVLAAVVCFVIAKKQKA